MYRTKDTIKNNLIINWNINNSKAQKKPILPSHDRSQTELL